ncbi:MAG: four helix bundle protein [Deltaproteobacteria bacterium]|nr:four helix bundle protein [Deltaproteobacteria bacterium]
MQGRTFKDLECWKKARELVKEIYQVTRSGSFSKDFGLRDQIQRSAVSVMANIAEGFGTFSDVEFIRFLSISIRSAYEVQSHLCVALDAGYLQDRELNRLDYLCNECINLAKGFIRYLKEKI